MRSVLKRVNPIYWQPRTLLTVAVVLLVGIFPAYIFFGFNAVASSSTGETTQLQIPHIGLSTSVTQLENDNGKLNTPDYIAGSFQQYTNTTLLIGHSSTVFQDLHNLEIGDQIQYDGSEYIVSGITVLAKSSINMGQVLSAHTQPTLILMTCTGDKISDQDYSHRLIITAVQR